eukprot:TRINITY_DN63855_c0_g1_i1.p1 TRINITY_DN63855_c0_g1~~TRINITY_DN63855_c0_g1_i1.p1  ORF type:complete len:322 (-),score=62.25 TRINITY_DN63855_c0_g1_i1:52-981(-)
MGARDCVRSDDCPRQAAFELFRGLLSEEEQSAAGPSRQCELQERFCDIIAEAAFELFGEHLSEVSDFSISQAACETVVDHTDGDTSAEPCRRQLRFEETGVDRCNVEASAEPLREAAFEAFEAHASQVDDKAQNVQPDVSQLDFDSHARQDGYSHGKKSLSNAQSTPSLSQLMVGSPSACLRLRRRAKTSYVGCQEFTVDAVKASKASAAKSHSSQELHSPVSPLKRTNLWEPRSPTSRLEPLKLARSCSLGALRSVKADKAVGSGLLPQLRAKMFNAAIDWSLGSAARFDLARAACGGEQAFMGSTIC